MRIRSIKPEFWRSDDIVALSLSARLTFIGMWSYVDDNGAGNAKVSSIIGDLYAEDMARDPQETLRRVSGDLQQLVARGLLVKYNDPKHPSRELYYVTNWTDHQLVNRPSKGNMYPLPDPETLVMARKSSTTPEGLKSVSGGSQESLSAGAGEQGSRGAGEQRIVKSGFQENPDADEQPPLRADVEELLDHLDEAITLSGYKKPNRTKTNRDAARLMLDHDKRTPETIHAAITYLPSDEFWRANIRSMSKLREKWDQLEASAKRSQSRNQRTPKLTRSEEIYLAEKRRIHTAMQQQGERQELTA